MERVYNFSAGPAALPKPVLERAKAEMLDYGSSGMSVMEMSHRSNAFVEIASRAEANLRNLLEIGEDYYVLFLQGGATAQFSAFPMNLVSPEDSIDYVSTGSWSQKAIAECSKYCHANVIASSIETGFDRIPEEDDWNMDSNSQFIHICSNETIGGVQFKEFPLLDKILIADMSSELLSRQININDFGLIYAGAQKNIGPAGLTIVIVRKDLCSKARPETPAVFNYGAQAEADSMLNTPPTYSWYLAGLVFEWLLELGGLDVVEKINNEKAQKLYDAIQASDFYDSPVDPRYRSTMNVPFKLKDESLDDAFLKKAEQVGLTNLKGHRSVGGMRASIYNGVPPGAVYALLDFMKEFEAEYG